MTVVRAITMPIVEPQSGTWQELREALRDMWGQTTQASNWIMRELYTRDVRRHGESKLSKYEYRYLYPELRIRFPALPPQSTAALERAITRKYKALRYKIIWTSDISLPTFRYPVPFAIPNQSWRCSFDDGNRPIVDARIGDKRWVFRLRGGPRYRRQIASFRQFIDGSAKRGEVAIYKSGDGEILCKMVGHFPVEQRESSGSLTLKTASDTLLIAYNESGEQVRFWNWPHLVRWIRENQIRLAKFGEDAKAEMRERGKKASFQHAQEAVSAKFNNRMDSAVKELAAQAIGLATRWKKASVVYDDSEKHAKLRELRNDGSTYRELFQWYKLRERLEQLCKERNIEFVYKGAE